MAALCFWCSTPYLRRRGGLHGRWRCGSAGCECWCAVPASDLDAAFDRARETALDLAAQLGHDPDEARAELEHPTPSDP